MEFFMMHFLNIKLSQCLQYMEMYIIKENNIKLK